MVERQVGARPQRPRAVTVVAVGHLLQGVALIVVGGILLLEALLAARYGGALDRTEWLELLALGSLLVPLGLLALTVTFSLFRMRPWAWLVAMTMQGMGLAVGLSSHFINDVDYTDDAGLAVGILIVFMLNQNEVRRAFQRRGTPA